MLMQKEMIRLKEFKFHTWSFQSDMAVKGLRVKKFHVKHSRLISPNWIHANITVILLGICMLYSFLQIF